MKNIDTWLTVGLVLAGLGGVFYGFYQIYEPLAYIVDGFCVFGLCLWSLRK